MPPTTATNEPADLFASNDPALLAVRRELRLALVPPPPAPPALDPSLEPLALNPIDRFILEKWADAGIDPRTIAVCDDATFARRVHLDLIGVGPTLDELDRFLTSADPDKRAALVRSLLARAGDYADHWTPFWEDAIASSYVNLQGGIPTRGNYRAWINQSFRENKPYDLFVAQLIDMSIPGAKQPEYVAPNGRQSRVAYVHNDSHTATLQTAAAAAQVFLGTAMKCASCHNHFENDEWPQDRFLAFAGLFGTQDLELIRCERRTGRTVASAFPFPTEGVPTDIPADETGRLRLAAALITDPANPRFARAIANRLWKRYVGLGLYEPADDFRLDVPPAHPELLDWLAHDLVAHGFDLKRTIELILTSRTYQLAHDPALADTFDVADKLAPRHYRSPTLRRLTAEQTIDSIRLAMHQHLDPAARLYHVNVSTALPRSLGKPASRNEISTQRPDDVAVVQSLELLNGPELLALVSDGPLLDRALPLPDTDAARTLYRAFLARDPSADEARIASGYLAAAEPNDPDARRAALIDLCWALIVSPEFQYLK